MSMLLLRQAPRGSCGTWPGGWTLPAAFPRNWLAATFGGCALFAILLAAITKNDLHRVWGIFGACSYLLAAMAVLAWRRRGPDLGLLIAVVGALAVPLWLMTRHGLRQPEVFVITTSARLFLHQGTPYHTTTMTAAAHSPNVFDPYLPVMSLFGVPRALLGNSPVTDPRIWFALAFIAAFAAALLVAGSRDALRWTLLVTSSPLIALSLTVGGTDVPVLGLLCLGLALLWRHPRPYLAALALGVAAGMKATAWPALVIVIVMVAARDGRRAAARFGAATLAVAAVLVGPVAARAPGSLVQNTIAFPLGLASVSSRAVSPLPGRLLTETGPAGHVIAVVLLLTAGLAIIVSLAIRPPRTVPAAAWRLAVALALMFTLAPATRFGYYMYPGGLLAWLAACRLQWRPVPHREQAPPAAAAAGQSVLG